MGGEWAKEFLSAVFQPLGKIPDNRCLWGAGWLGETASVLCRLHKKAAYPNINRLGGVNFGKLRVRANNFAVKFMIVLCRWRKNGAFTLHLWA